MSEKKNNMKNVENVDNMDNMDNMMHISKLQMHIAEIMPNTKYFDSRFENLNIKVEEMRRNQDLSREQTRDLKLDMDLKLAESKRDMLERFAQVDKRFEQVDKRFEQVDKRFEQVDKRIDEFRRDTKERFEQVDNRIDEFRRDTKERFEQVDKRFEQVIVSINRIGDLLEKRDEKQRSFTLRMFSIAISFSIIGVFGVFVKMFIA